MPKRISKLAKSIKHLGEIQVTEWDFMALLNADIKEFEISRALRRLGKIQVMEWDLRTALPAVNKLAKREVDVVGFVKRAAHYRVMEWDFRSALPVGHKDTPRGSDGLSAPCLNREAMQATTGRLKDFLQYVAVNLIDEPGHAQIKVAEIAPNVLRFKQVLVKRDVAMLIGREGHTASAIRGILKAVARMNGVHALLEIHSHEDEME